MFGTQVIEVAEAYSKHTGLMLSTLGAYAVNDGRFLTNLKETGRGGLRTAERALQWFSDHWAADLEWPRHIPRPPRSKEAA